MFESGLRSKVTSYWKVRSNLLALGGFLLFGLFSCSGYKPDNFPGLTEQQVNDATTALDAAVRAGDANAIKIIASILKAEGGLEEVPSLPRGGQLGHTPPDEETTENGGTPNEKRKQTRKPGVPGDKKIQILTIDAYKSQLDLFQVSATGDFAWILWGATLLHELQHANQSQVLEATKNGTTWSVQRTSGDSTLECERDAYNAQLGAIEGAKNNMSPGQAVEAGKFQNRSRVGFSRRFGQNL